MSGTPDLLLGDIRQLLRREVGKAAGRADIDEAASAFLLPDIPGLSLGGPLTRAAGTAGGQRTHHDVAILGFARQEWDDENKGGERFQEGLQWLIGRTPYSASGMPSRFVSDPIALFGIALGARNSEVSHSQVSAWLDSFLKTTFQCALPWQRGIVIATGLMMGLTSVPPSEVGGEDADVRTALRGLGILPALDAEGQSAETRAALLLMQRQHGETTEIIQIAFRLCALEQVLQFSPAISVIRPTIEQLANMLRRIPGALKRWTWEDTPRTRNGEARKWHIDNEYHVQNLLYFALAPIFPDLKEEDYSASVGHVHPRLDLVIPSLNVIIEVKYVRPGESFTKVTGEIASDNTLYRPKGHRDKKIIVFVWDDSSRIQEHATLVQGLLQMDGVEDAIVVARPGNFLRVMPTAQSSASPSPSPAST